MLMAITRNVSPSQQKENRKMLLFLPLAYQLGNKVNISTAEKYVMYVKATNCASTHNSFSEKKSEWSFSQSRSRIIHFWGMY